MSGALPDTPMTTGERVEYLEALALEAEVDIALYPEYCPGCGHALDTVPLGGVAVFPLGSRSWAVLICADCAAASKTSQASLIEARVLLSAAEARLNELTSEGLDA